MDIDVKQIHIHFEGGVPRFNTTVLYVEGIGEITLKENLYTYQTLDALCAQARVALEQKLKGKVSEV